ncbi:hypothetical protein D1872_68040 [compost metagenome]
MNNKPNRPLESTDLDYPAELVYQRIAELRMMQMRCFKQGINLPDAEQLELGTCLDRIVNNQWAKAILYNKSFFAHESNDVDWQHEICADLEDLRSNEQ